MAIAPEQTHKKISWNRTIFRQKLFHLVLMAYHVLMVFFWAHVGRGVALAALLVLLLVFMLMLVLVLLLSTCWQRGGLGTACRRWQLLSFGVEFSLSLARINIMYRGTGLYKLLHTAIPDRTTWSKLGEHGEHREHWKDGKHQLDDL